MCLWAATWFSSTINDFMYTYIVPASDVHCIASRVMSRTCVHLPKVWKALIWPFYISFFAGLVSLEKLIFHLNVSVYWPHFYVKDTSRLSVLCKPLPLFTIPLFTRFMHFFSIAVFLEVLHTVPRLLTRIVGVLLSESSIGEFINGLIFFQVYMSKLHGRYTSGWRRTNYPTFSCFLLMLSFLLILWQD